ncbi:MAG: RtcB family protein [Nanoarchaeota archaeon]
MVNIKKINEYTWEIPKENGMKVPGRIFASEKLFEKIKNDLTFEQIKNVAKLPGIIGYSLAMSDAHQAYGMCVGGVAAFDSKKGIISPGAVGFDINCLTGNSSIVTEFGGSMKIENFEKLQSELEIDDNGRKIKKIVFSSQLSTLNNQNKSMEGKPVNLIMSRNAEKVSEITLESGLKIKTTEEHPFLTKEGMQKISEISLGKLVGVDLFEGIELNEEIDEKEAIIAKIMGYLFGDGNFSRLKTGLRASAYGKKEDLEEIKKDLERIRVKSYIYSRERDHSINTRYGNVKFRNIEYSLHINSQEFNRLLEQKGLILGNKTRQEVRIPQWIKESKPIIKRLFLAGFFGAEMSTPKTLSKTCFFCPTIDQNKIESLSQNARDFLIDLSLLLEEFGINNTKISEIDDFHNKYGEKTKRFRLFVKGEEDMLKLWRNIGFEYNQKRKNMANIASLYILLKKQENNKRLYLARKIKEYKNRGFKLKEVKKILFKEINERFIERHYYEDAAQRIKLDFISFKDFKRLKLEELNNYGTIFDKIAEKKEIIGNHRVYDFNVQDNHNFIANGFVVSNCGVRLLISNLDKKQFLSKRKDILKEIYNAVPSGVGKKSKFNLNNKEIDNVLTNGVGWAIDKGYGEAEDKELCEDNGQIIGADSKKISAKARGRGMNQLGTLGAGNHFLEIAEVESIYDERVAKIFGIKNVGQITVMIHSGSRGVGHQVASDYMKKMEEEYGYKHLPDRQLAYAKIDSVLGKDYLAAMAGAANFGFTNRHLIMHQVRESFGKHFPKSELNLVYDLAHNIAKFEDHTVDGKKMKLLIHRKGATRSFGPGRKEIPLKYRKVGCPIFIPGSMGTYSYVLVGTKKAEELTFGSTAHGAGRILSRSEASRTITPQNLAKEMNDKDIILESASMKGAVDEAPAAYKDVNEVVRVSDELGIGKMVARLKPLGVVKG